MDNLIAGILLGAGFALCYLTFALVVAIICRVPFVVVAKFWKSYED